MKTDVLIVGAGIAGLAAALALDGRSIVVISGQPLGHDLASAWAQGGIAAVLDDREDSPQLHAADTLGAGAGIAERGAVDALVDEAPSAVVALARLGVPFDRDRDGRLALGLEGAHSHRRIVHAADMTGAAAVAALIDAVRARPNVWLRERMRAAELLLHADGAVAGALVIAPNGEVVTIAAHAVVLASGGFGGLFARTTTPLGARGSGIAMAARVGAALADLEFVQFHPTALRVAADPLPVVSEALRGEGATLVDARGGRIMDGVDPRGELAPRDIVSRAVAAVERDGGEVFLDARAAIGAAFPKRFPSIFAAARCFGIDPRTELLPITTAAHYTIGGVATVLRGRSSVPGLWACGEVAATGLHGANRLASNSLAEGLVFGARVWPRHRGDGARRRGRRWARAARAVRGGRRSRRQTATAEGRDERGTGRRARRRRDRSRTRRFVALERTERDARVSDAAFIASAVAHAALAWRESRGAHFRADHPAPHDRFAHRAVQYGHTKH